MAGEGVKTALAGGAGVQDGAAARLEQLALLPAAAAADAAAIAAPAGGGAVARGPGRPAGSRNKTTAAWSEYLLGRYGSPVERALKLGLARPADFLRWLQAEQDELARTGRAVALLPVGATLLDVVKLQAQLLDGAAPYVHGKMPVDLNVKGSAFTVVIGGGADLALAPDGESLRVTVAAPEPQNSEENQGGVDAS